MGHGFVGYLAGLLSFLIFGAGANAQTTARVEVFTPQGTVKDVRQVSARFSKAMTALGDPRLDDPFTIDCPQPGQGRWADGRNWVYDFDGDLPGGVVCTFSLKDDLRAYEGAALAGQRVFRFDTGGPSIRASLPREGWTVIDEEQVFILALDAEATKRSIEDHAYCAVAGLAERMPVRLIEGEERDAILAQREKLGYGFYSILWKDGELSHHRIRDGRVADAQSGLVLLSCARPLPPATQVQLVWGEGVEAPSGVATGIDQKLAFRTRPAFTARLECERANPQAGCLPIKPVSLVFSAPVPRDLAFGARIQTSEGQIIAPIVGEGEEPVVESVRFPPSYTALAAFELHLPDDIKDDAGRALENAASFPLAFESDDFPPLAKFPARFGILEAGEGGILPITLRNLDTAERPDSIEGRKLKVVSTPSAVSEWLRRQDGRYRGQSIFNEGDALDSFDIPITDDGKAAEVVGIPLGTPGFYMVEVASPKLGAALNGRESIYHTHTAVLVTNMAVHLKWGRERTLIWVTKLDDGTSVAGADLVLTDSCSGQELWRGKSGKDGTAFVDGQVLGEPSGYGSCYYSSHPIIMASAAKGDDFSFTLSTWNDGIEPHAFRLPMGNTHQSHKIHTVFDRPLYRAGETVSMKHFFRSATMAGVDWSERGRSVPIKIRHNGSGQTYDFHKYVRKDGTVEQIWQIPEEAKLGDYTVYVPLDGYSWHESGRFKVQQFRVPTMKAVVQGPAKPQINPDDVTFDLHLGYLSGGSASGAEVKLRSVGAPLPLRFPGYDDYSFNSDESDESSANTTQVMPLRLDENGAARVVLSVGKLTGPQRITAEMDYADANGEILTAVGRADVWPSSLAVGIRREGWVASEAQMRFRVLILDVAGKPVAGQPVTARLFSKKTYSYRKRLIGGFYAYESFQETNELETKCEGRTDERGLLLCDVEPGASGQIVVRAETTDALGNSASATTSIWVVGEDDWWFGSTAGDRMDVLPEKQDYEAGDVARFQVRMPFREATALVSVEREGVLDSFVTSLSGQEPIIEIPIKANYAPNVFVSVLAVRGRVGGFKSWLSDQARDYDLGDWISRDGGRPTALVDLSKPAYRLGNAEIRVGWAPHRLDVTVAPEDSVYQIRDTAHVRFKVARADGSPLPPRSEIAVAVVDEGLLELAPNPSWDLLAAMMGQRGIEVWTSTAQMQVVGKRHYGRKAVPHGGGGGRERARELFDTLLAWHGRVRLDKEGEAMLDIPLNDSLTRFRIIAVAHAGADLFGTGSASISTTQDLILHAGVPPLVREQDQFAATFTLRNTSDRNVDVEVTARVEALATALPPQRISLKAGEARDISWTLKAPVGRQDLIWDVTAKETGGTAIDHLKITQKIVPAYPVRVYQATIAQLDGNLDLPVERPHDAITGRGGIDVVLRERLGDGLDGVRDFMQWYDYVCLEQNISKAVALRDFAQWQAWEDRLPAYMDKDGLLKYFPVDWLEGEDILTSYVLAIAHEAGWEIGEGTRARLIAALQDFIEGRIVRRSALPTADLTVRKLAAIEALSRYGEADRFMLSSITIDPNLWPTSAVIDWMNIVTRIEDLPKREERLLEAEQIIRTRLNFQGTTMGFATERNDALWWLMINTDVNAVRALSTLLERPAWREDVPRLVRGALGRQLEGHWSTTTANAWGVLAMEKFSAVFEKQPVTGRTALTYAGASQNVDWAGEDVEQSAAFPWNDGPASLSISHQGSGKPWAMVQAKAALPLKEALSSGYKIIRTLTPVEQQKPGQWTRGDIVRVRLELEAQSDMTWVVVDDPIPAGATILGSGLGGQSAISTASERREGWVWPAFEERRFDAFRAYYRFVPKGKWAVEYTMRLNNPGQFQMPATRVEAMYAPEMFGELPNEMVQVEGAE